MKLLQMIELYTASLKGSVRKQARKELDSYVRYLEGPDSNKYMQTVCFDPDCSIRLETPVIEEDVRGFIKSKCNSAESKNRHLEALKDLWQYIAGQWGLDMVPLANMETIPETPFERQVEILRFIQENPGNNVDKWDIEDRFLIADTTLKTDINSIRYGKGLWKHSPVDIVSFDNGLSYDCSVHPLILNMNLTMLAELLVLLQSQQREPFELLAAQIWHQLTPYAQKQIRKVDSFNEPGPAPGFVAEREIKELRFRLIKLMKEERFATIVFQANGKIKTVEGKVNLRDGKHGQETLCEIRGQNQDSFAVDLSDIMSID